MKFELSDSWPQHNRDDALSPTSLVMEDGPSFEAAAEAVRPSSRRKLRPISVQRVVAACDGIQEPAEPQTMRILCVEGREGSIIEEVVKV
jgi:hypothetical protein